MHERIALMSGRIKEPSFGKIHAISRAMGIPLEAWLEEASDRGDV